MAASSAPVFLVDSTSDPVVVKVRGRASFMNSQPIREFLQHAIRGGQRRFAIDFSECTGMDSTFLGVLAGTALELRKSVPKGSLVFCKLGTRNLELVRNLGLHRLATVDTGDECLGEMSGAGRALEQSQLDEIENARLCLDAHESLIEADADNLGKFQDVISLLKGRLEEG